MLKKTSYFFCFLTIFFAAHSLWAWGSEGHKTIALIAWTRLGPQAKSTVHELLGPGESMESVASWADHIEKERPETAPWHYINLNVRQPVGEFDLSDACKDHDCVVDQIDKDMGILKASFVSKRDKREALKFLIHFVGDLHQPLHCADDHDRGGNEKWFRYYTTGSRRRYEWVNFHAFWDNLLQTHGGGDPNALARALERKISTNDEKEWEKGKASDWALESYTIARDDLYADLPEGPLLEKNHWGRDLPEEYYSDKMKIIMFRQLEKAGVRLAYLLNALFEGKSDPSVFP